MLSASILRARGPRRGSRSRRQEIENVTGRRVINFASQIVFDPDVVVTTFVFDRELGAGFVAAEHIDD